MKQYRDYPRVREIRDPGTATNFFSFFEFSFSVKIYDRSFIWRFKFRFPIFTCPFSRIFVSFSWGCEKFFHADSLSKCKNPREDARRQTIGSYNVSLSCCPRPAHCQSSHFCTCSPWRYWEIYRWGVHCLASHPWSYCNHQWLEWSGQIGGGEKEPHGCGQKSIFRLFSQFEDLPGLQDPF